MRIACAKMVPKLLSNEQNERRKELSLELLQRIENEPDSLISIITCDENWVFSYYPVTKRLSMQWNSSSSPRKGRESLEVLGHVEYFL
jgi:hypothetical protein